MIELLRTPDFEEPFVFGVMCGVSILISLVLVIDIVSRLFFRCKCNHALDLKDLEEQEKVLPFDERLAWRKRMFKEIYTDWDNKLCVAGGLGQRLEDNRKLAKTIYEYAPEILKADNNAVTEILRQHENFFSVMLNSMREPAELSYRSRYKRQTELARKAAASSVYRKISEYISNTDKEV
jgi:hypothetical protein